MRDLLFLTQRIPYPPEKGEKIRPLRILRHLAQTYRIHLGCFVDDARDWAHVPVVRNMCSTACFEELNERWAKMTCVQGLISNQPLSCSFFWNRSLAHWVKRTLDEIRPEVVFMCSSVMAQFVIYNEAMPPISVMDFADVDSDKWLQYAQSTTIPLSWVFAREGRLLLEYDRFISMQTTASTFVTEAEAALFRKLAPESAAKTFVVQNGVDSQYFSPTHSFENPYKENCPVFVFTGTMTYWPNVQAVSWFAREVVPMLQRQLGEMRFYIVGSNPTWQVLKLARNHAIVVTGRVADVRPYLMFATAAVVPLWITRGIQNKLLEAMSMAKPTITTPAVLGSLPIVAEREVIVADSAQSFAAACAWVTCSPEAKEVGKRARHRMITGFRWSDRLKDLDVVLAGTTYI